jgi:hypothetical protein
MGLPADTAAGLTPATSSHNPASSNSQRVPSFMYRGESHVQVCSPSKHAFLCRAGAAPHGYLETCWYLVASGAVAGLAM